jgi:hypothetical protein
VKDWGKGSARETATDSGLERGMEKAMGSDSVTGRARD